MGNARALVFALRRLHSRACFLRADAEREVSRDVIISHCLRHTSHDLMRHYAVPGRALPSDPIHWLGELEGNKSRVPSSARADT